MWMACMRLQEYLKVAFFLSQDARGGNNHSWVVYLPHIKGKGEKMMIWKAWTINTLVQTFIETTIKRNAYKTKILKIVAGSVFTIIII